MTCAFTVAISDKAISAAKIPPTFEPNRCEAASAPTATSPFKFLPAAPRK